MPAEAKLSFPGCDLARLTSSCTVFAATEILSRIRAGDKVEDIVKGAFRSVAKRILEMDLVDPPLVLTGGVVAHNPILVKLLAESFGKETLVCPDPQFAGAFGAALFALERVAEALPPCATGSGAAVCAVARAEPHGDTGNPPEQTVAAAACPCHTSTSSCHTPPAKGEPQLLIMNPPVAITEDLLMLGTAAYPLYLFKGRGAGLLFEGGTSAMGPLLGQQLERLGRIGDSGHRPDGQDQRRHQQRGFGQGGAQLRGPRHRLHPCGGQGPQRRW